MLAAPVQPMLAAVERIRPLSRPLREALGAALQVQDLPAGHHLLRPGEVARHIYFLETGLAQGYESRPNGQEVASWFMREGDFVISIVSLLTQTPSTEFVQLLEPARVHVIAYARLQQLYAEFPEANFVGRVLTERYYVLSEQRAYYLRARPARERYEQLLRDFPDVFRRVAVRHVAAYLGMAPETLSRLRAAPH